MQATERFVEVVTRPDDSLPLDEGAFLLASHANPRLDVARQLERLDDLATNCASTVGGLVDRLFGDLGFRGDSSSYYDPRNSMLDQVVDRRIGIPITLSVLMLEVGRRIGLALQGVGMPGHFLVREPAEEDDVATFYDPFGGGRRLDAKGCEGIFRHVAGGDECFETAFLEPVGPRAILARMLANLRRVYLAQGELASLSWVLTLSSVIPGSDPACLAELAQARARLGDLDEAAAALDELATRVGGDTRELALAEATRLRAKLN